MTNTPVRMPAVFFGHGNPMNALERNRYTEAWRSFGQHLPHKPKAALAEGHDAIVSAVGHPRQQVTLGAQREPVRDAPPGRSPA